MIPEGFGTIVEARKPPLPPRALLPASDLSGLRAYLTAFPVLLDWPALDEAVSYRVQVFVDGNLDAVLVDAVTEGPGFELGKLPDGRYVLRVRGIDDIALEGMDAEHPFVIEFDEVPVIAEASFRVDENPADGTAIGRVPVVEPDANDT